MVLMLPEPDAAPQVAPPDAAHVHAAPVIVAGIVSAMTAPTMFDGPVGFDATIV